MIPKGRQVQLCNDHRLPLDQGSIVFVAGSVGEIVTPGDLWARVSFTETVSVLVPTHLLREVKLSAESCA